MLSICNGLFWGQLHGGGNNRINPRFVPAAETCDQVRNKCSKTSACLSEIVYVPELGTNLFAQIQWQVKTI
jgi:hypothetical protein